MHTPPLSRRAVLRAGAAATLAAAVPAAAGTEDALASLDRTVRAAMAAHAIPGVAIGLHWRGRDIVRTYGITNVDHPQPVEEDTLFRIGSTTKTFTGTAAMTLVDSNVLDLDLPVSTWLPGFATKDPTVAATVTLRHLLNHTPGWLGDMLQDFGPGDDALARYVAAIATLPQLTPPGSTFFYNNAGITLAGHLVAQTWGTTYERAVEDLVLTPLGLRHTAFSTDALIGRTFAASHMVVDGRAVVEPLLWPVPRALHPTGGLISSIRDQLAYARFHLGQGRTADGVPLLTPSALAAMHSNPGPGGTLLVELDGMGLTFQLRPTVLPSGGAGPRIAQHGGDWGGQHSGFLLVPERDFALIVLTNSDGGPALLSTLTADDWALSLFEGLHNLPADPQPRDSGTLAPYEGDYTLTAIGMDGATAEVTSRMKADAAGGLTMDLLGPDGAPMPLPPEAPQRLAFYRDDYVLVQDGTGDATGYRADFVRGEDGVVAWFRFAGRLARKVA